MFSIYIMSLTCFWVNFYGWFALYIKGGAQMVTVNYESKEGEITFRAMSFNKCRNLYKPNLQVG